MLILLCCENPPPRIPAFAVTAPGHWRPSAAAAGSGWKENNEIASDSDDHRRFAAMTSASFASCNVRDMYTDKQTACASACEGQLVGDKRKFELGQGSKAVGFKKACDAKCCCEQNSQ
jgi:hypothetical protein